MYTYLIHPITGNQINLFTNEGKQLLKQYVRLVQNGGGCDETDSCSKCGCECTRMGDERGIGGYGSANSNVTRRTFTTCMDRSNAKLTSVIR